MDQRIQLIGDWLSGEYNKSELSRMYEISRPTGDKWIARYQARGVQGLEELARTPHSHPNQTSEELRLMIVAEKLRHQRWGPKKVLDRRNRERPTHEGQKAHERPRPIPGPVQAHVLDYLSDDDHGPDISFKELLALYGMIRHFRQVLA